MKIGRKERMGRIDVMSENLGGDPGSSGSLNSFLERIEEGILNRKPKIIFIDNITTSSVSDLSPREQRNAISGLRNLAQRYQIPIVLVAHPAKGSFHPGKELTQSDIRGNSSVMNMSSYIYVIQNCFNLSPIRTLLKVEKSRHHSEAQNTYYELFFKKLKNEQGFYERDETLCRSSFIQIIKENGKN